MLIRLQLAHLIDTIFYIRVAIVVALFFQLLCKLIYSRSLLLSFSLFLLDFDLFFKFWFEMVKLANDRRKHQVVAKDPSENETYHVERAEQTAKS